MKAAGEGEIQRQVWEKVQAALLDERVVWFDLSADDENGRAGPTVNRSSAEFIASFLHETPRIQGLSFISNIQRDDGAMHVVAKALGSTDHVSTVCLWGDEVERPGASRPPLSASTQVSSLSHRVDDGSVLECLLSGLGQNSSISRIRFHSYNLGPTHANYQHLGRLLSCKRNLKMISFSACDFGRSGISLLCQGLALQTQLQEFCIDMNEYDKKLSDRSLAAIVTGLGHNPCLRNLTLYDCGLGPHALQALMHLLSQPHCRIGGLCLGRCGKLFQDQDLTHQFMSVLGCSNLSLHRIRAGCRTQQALQQTIQVCIRRNYLLSRIHGLLAARDSMAVAEWSMVLGALLSNEPASVSATPMFHAMVALVPKLTATTSGICNRKRRACPST